MPSLLEQYRNIAIGTSITLTTANVFLLTGSFTLPNLYSRAIALATVAAFSTVNLKLLFHAQRLEPILHLTSEYYDTETILALSQKANVDIGKVQQPTISVQDLTLDHFLFLDLNGRDHAKKLLTWFVSRNPKIKLLDLNDETHKFKYTSLISERRSGSQERDPVIVFSDTFYASEALELARMQIFLFTISEQDQPVRKKIGGSDFARSIEPDSKVTLAYYDGIKLYQLAIV